MKPGPEVIKLFFMLRLVEHGILNAHKCKYSEIRFLLGSVKPRMLLYPRHLCRGVYSFRLDVCPFVRSYVRLFVRSCVRSFVTFRHVRRIYIKVFG